MSAVEVNFSIESEADLSRAIAGSGKLARHLGFEDAGVAGIMTAVSELGRNILKYAATGRIRLTRVNEGGRCGIEICAEDKGPGIPDVEQALRDHFSTGGTLGLGLPGVRRMLDDFAIESRPNAGTRVRGRKWR
jgi:serine/threonine-protein kinase RsbT